MGILMKDFILLKINIVSLSCLTMLTLLPKLHKVNLERPIHFINKAPHPKYWL